MARQPEAPRVGAAVPVEDDEVGDATEPLEGADRGGGLAEGEVARDVRKARGFANPDLLDRLSGRRVATTAYSSPRFTPSESPAREGPG
jgi:hypothetical protein